MGYRGNYTCSLDWELIARLYAAGDGTKAIGQSVGASPAGIREGLIKRGLYQFGQNRKRNAVGAWAGYYDFEIAPVIAQELAYDAIWRKAHPTPRKTAMERYYANHTANKRKAGERAHNRYWVFEKSDALAQAVRSVRRILARITRPPAPRRKPKKENILGCTYDEARTHLESQFTDTQSWATHGKTWEIDHIVPLAKFNLLDPIELRQAAHYINLRPLCCTLNRQLGGKTRRARVCY